MARTRTGTSTVIQAARVICRMQRYGLYDLEAATSPAFKAAVVALQLACTAWEALDDYPGEIDATVPIAGEDIVAAP